jgi:hypothetical protein
MKTLLALLFCAATLAAADYKVLATTKTSTMDKELNEAAQQGFVFKEVMGGSTVASNETVIIMERAAAGAPPRVYKLLATSKTSTMQKELQQLAQEGFEYVGQSIFETTFRGSEVVVIMERDPAQTVKQWEYLLLATTKTGTMQKEISTAAEQGYSLVGLTVAPTAFRGSEIVTILRRPGK